MTPLNRSFTTITVYAVITRMLGFFFRIYLAAEIGAMMLGIYQVAFSFFIVLLGIVASGIPLTVSAYTARYPGDRARGGGITVSGLVISIAVTAVTVALVFLGKKPITAILSDPRSYSVLLMLVPALVFSGLSSSFRGSIWGRRHYHAVSRVELAEQITRIAACVLLISFAPAFLDDKAHIAAFSMSIGCAVSGIALVCCFFMDGYRLARPIGLKPLFSTSAPITVVHVASSAVNLLIAIVVPARLIAGGLSPDTVMTLYGESVGMGLSLLFVPLTLTGSLSMALVPELADNMQTSSCEHVRTLCSNGLNFAVIIAGVFVPVFLALGNPIGMLLFGSSRCGDFLVKGAAIMLPLALEQIASSMMNSLGLEKRAFVNFCIGTAILLLLLWFLTPVLGVDALIIAMIASYSVSMILHTIALRQRLSVPLDFLKTLLKVAAAALPAAGIGFFLNNLLRPVGVLWAPVLSAAVILLCMGLGYLALGVVKYDLFGAIKKRRRRKSKRSVKSKSSAHAVKQR